ncbi:hypothetical protein LO762_04665 [Actinocorallia sp. API 0066]|uniref:hypothetical protein n=1 Tax=Actinocorallia sp. API 0066 TaxID=2896846 RepID=UPI001E531451|nr:hypothetical protein [Actinocorallia sp. API 0066]MCD0448490.1 hypothetical protein [Actinocorallia sp. API 0066]
MPVSAAHEARTILIREHPDLVSHFCTALGLKTPHNCTLALGPEDANDFKPFELTRDRTITFTNHTGTVEFAVCFEVQLRKDPSREWAWPLYQARLRHDLRCPVAFLVLTPDPNVVHWCAEGFDLGHPDLIFRPLTIGPANIPTTLTLETAQKNLPLAALSAMTHGNKNRNLLKTVCTALDSLPDPDEAVRYHNLILGTLNSRSRTYVETLMQRENFSYSSPWTDSLRAEGKAEVILTVLRARRVLVTNPMRERITGCADLDQLDRWAERAVTVTSADQLFDD